MIPTVIIEDDINHAELLQMQLATLCSKIVVIATATTVNDAINIIKKHKPELVFLDIQLSGSNAFDLLKYLDDWDFEIIITSCYSSFKTEAIQAGVADYIEKPITIPKLCMAVNLAEKRIKKKQKYMDFPQQGKLIISTDKGKAFINHDNIILVKAQNGCCTICTQNGENINTSLRLYEIEQELPQSMFFKPHRSYLINLDYITYCKFDTINIITMCNNEKVPIAKDNKKALKLLIKNMNNNLS